MARTKKAKSASSGPSQSQSASSKKVRIIEPSEEEGTVAVSAQKSVSGQPKSILKGKAPMTSSSAPVPSSAQDSDSETESISPGKMVPKRKGKAKVSGPGESSRKYSRKKVTTLDPPEGYVNSTLYITEHAEYELKYKNRALCPGIYVNLEDIKALGIDVIEYLEHYRKLIEINMPYSPEMVRIFYNNMKSNSLKDDEGNITHHSLVTKIRGVEIIITAENLNDFLGTHEYDEELKNFTDEEIFELLRPGEEYPKRLSFDPASMPVIQRTIHYIYSRCLVNKSKNYTHFAKGDYAILASIMAKEKRSIGHLVFNEMWRFRFSNSKRMTVPYPCLVSRILDIHQVWYIVEKIEYPILFSAQHFHRMNIDVVKVESHPTKKRKTTSASSRGQDEAQSSAPPQSPSAPSFANAAIQHYLDTEFRRLGVGFVKVFKSDLEEYTKELLTASREYFSGKSLEDAILSLSKDLISFKDIVLSKFDSLQSSVTSLDSRVGSIEQFIRDSQASTSAPPPPPSQSPEDPPSDAALAMINFSSSFLNPEPQPIPAPPVSSLAPSDPPIAPDDSAAVDPQPIPDPAPSSPLPPPV